MREISTTTSRRRAVLSSGLGPVGFATTFLSVAFPMILLVEEAGYRG